MGYTERLGYEQNGLPAGKRVLREPGTFVTRNAFKNAQNLVLDILNFIWTVIYISARNFLRMFTAKPKSLRGKVCFVTGSGRGLGRGICIVLAKEGAIIACADINEEANRKTVEILTEMGAKAKAYKLNVADKEEVDAIATRVESELGAVYLLVNNAAIVMPSPGVNEGYVRAVFGVNTLGPIWTVAAFLPKMKERHEGHIVNISSMAAAAGPPCLSFYTATKAAISAYGDTLRMSLIQSGYDDIYVTTVHPGTINTSQDYTDSFSGRLKVFSEEEVAEFVLNSIKYNKENVSTDPFLFFIGQFLKFLPREILASAVGIMDLQVTFPTEKEYNDLEVGQLVQESNRIGGKKKEKLTS